MSQAIALLAGCLVSFSLFASATEVKGARSCSKWIEEKRIAKSAKELNKIPVLITRSWFLGYLSGRADASGRNFLKGTDSDSIFLWLDNYCQANPQADLDKAGIDLAGELMQLKGIKP
jgi:hypothetical protein